MDTEEKAEEIIDEILGDVLPEETLETKLSILNLCMKLVESDAQNGWCVTVGPDERRVTIDVHYENKRSAAETLLKYQSALRDVVALANIQHSDSAYFEDRFPEFAAEVEELLKGT